MRKAPVLLAILDGWGISENDDNPLKIAYTPNLDFLYKNYLSARLNASGEYVGLPRGQMGNSEVGHTTIGAGRVLMQDLPKISHAIATKEIENHSDLNIFLTKVKMGSNRCHILGLLSDGGVHSHIDHFFWAVKFFSEKNCTVFLHVFLDGRDSTVESRGKYVELLSQHFKFNQNVKLATISGRYYAMDRDKRWERTEQAFKAIFQGVGLNFNNYNDCFDYHAKLKITDEFFLPSTIGEKEKILDNDNIVIINFRADRVRQILDAALSEEFHGFQIAKKPKINALAMTEYSSSLSEKMFVLFRNEILKNTLGEVIANHGLKQLRIAETEKYAHVTFFFNCGQEKAFEGEERVLINSPLVTTYDLQPEMSALKITELLMTKLKDYDFILLNFANMDMVGHTGNFKAAVKAIEVIDRCIGEIVTEVKKLKGDALITSDHGNIEQMKELSGGIHTYHTTNLVPIILISERLKHVTLRDGNLADIAPTILHIMNLTKPKEMTGKSLIELAKV